MTSKIIARPLIQIRDLRKVYQTPAGDFTAVNGINVEVQRGEFVAIIGNSLGLSLLASPLDHFFRLRPFTSGSA